MKENKRILGIDIGTVNSSVSIWNNGKPEIIPNEENNNITPSIVSFTKNERIIGENAISQLIINYPNTIYDIKRFIGKEYEEIEKDKKYYPFKIVKEITSNKIKIHLTFKDKIEEFYPEEILACLYEKMKQISKEYLKTEINDAIITCPAHFNIIKRKDIQTSAKIAGLNIIRILNKTTSAALTYRNLNDNKDDKNVLFFHLGGGNYEVSIILFENNLIGVKSIDGDSHFGGIDFDNKLVDFCVEKFKKKYNIDMYNDEKAIARLKKECVKKKIELSNCNKVTIEVDNLKDDHDFNINLTRNDFEEICKDLFNKCIPIIEKVLKNAKLTKEKIGDIILLGGSSKIPKIKEIIKNYFKREINDNIINPKESISIGASIQGAIINNIADENLKKLTLFDICCGSIGVVRKGEMKFLIPKDSIIPCKKTEKYKTTKDNQDTLVLKIYQGENKIAKENKFLGNWIISNIPQKPKGEIIIDVDYEIDINNFLSVTARTIEKDKNHKIKNINILKVDIDNNVMDEELIDELIEKEKDLEEEDEKEYQRNKLKNQLERYLYEIEKIGTEEEKLIAEKYLKWLKENPNESVEKYEEKLRQLKNSVKINFDDLDNIIPLSLGLELRNGEMDFLIRRNTRLPYEKTYTFKTGIDNQSKIVLRVYQGERIVAQENKFLGKFIISNIPSRPKGEVKVDVRFMLQNKDVMHIQVKINGLNQINNFTYNIENDYDEREIEKLVKIAKEKEKEDREFIENINKLEAEAMLE